MHFFRDGCVTDFCSCKIGIQYILYISSVLESSCMPYTLRFSTLAPGFVLPPASMQSSTLAPGFVLGNCSCIALPPASMQSSAIAPALLYHRHPWRRTSCDPHGCGKCQSDVGTSLAFHAVVRAVLPCPHEKITIFRGALII